MYFCKQKQTEMSQPNPQVRVRLTGVSALLHFLVDGLCICCLYLTTADCAEMVMTYVTYNVLAFLTQPLTGWGADKIRQKHWMLLGSVLLLTLAVMLASIRMMVETPNAIQALLLSMTICLGMGNSLFHVWGGKQTAVRTKNDIRSLGVFVSTGAFGLAIGGVFASWWLLYVFLLGICALAVMALFFFPERNHTYESGTYSAAGGWKGIWLLIVFIMLIVAGRSFVGEAFTKDITKTTRRLVGQRIGNVESRDAHGGGNPPLLHRQGHPHRCDADRTFLGELHHACHPLLGKRAAERTGRIGIRITGGSPDTRVSARHIIIIKNYATGHPNSHRPHPHHPH